jgi:YD repeat-containing protein
MTGSTRIRIVHDVDKANLKGAVRTVTTERQIAGSVFVEERTFDTDGRLLSFRRVRDGVPSDLATELSGGDFSIRSLHNPDGSRTDIQQIIGIDAWSMEGLSVALGTHGAALARTTFDSRGVAVETVFVNVDNEVTTKIHYACDEEGRILHAIQTLGPGFGTDLPAQVLNELLAQLPEGEWCRLSFHYDEEGHVIEWTSYLLGKQSHHEVTTYNRHGDKETVTTDDQGTTRLEYEYDAQGNWTRQVTHHPAGIFVENRVITYF